MLFSSWPVPNHHPLYTRCSIEIRYRKPAIDMLYLNGVGMMVVVTVGFREGERIKVGSGEVCRLDIYYIMLCYIYRYAIFTLFFLPHRSSHLISFISLIPNVSFPSYLPTLFFLVHPSIHLSAHLPCLPSFLPFSPSRPYAIPCHAMLHQSLSHRCGRTNATW